MITLPSRNLKRFYEKHRLHEVMRIRDVPVLVHWSVFVVSVLLILYATKRPLIALVGLLCYWSVLLIHECGHMVFAQRKGCKVFSIELYPICGFCRFQQPWLRIDHCVIAWGGVLAQLLVGLPIVACVAVFGDTRSETVNTALTILGGYSVFVALLNLLPIRPLDGSVAWGLVPEFLRGWRERRKKRKNKGTTDWRTY
jgi:Zn-dependent protease